MGKEKYEDALLQSISILAEQAVKKAGYDKTIRATIIKCVDPTIEQYKVRYQDSYYYAYGNGAGVNYPVGANVYILVPKGDMSQLKTILGTVQKLGINYVNPIAEENKYEQTGNNVVKTLSEGEFGLCSYKTEDTIILYDITPKEQKDHIKKIDINNKNLKYYLQTASHLCCSFYIRTDLNNQQKYKGKYGIRITAKYKDVKDKTKSITQNHTIDIDIMEGNPYNFEKAVLQKVFIEIDTVNFQEIVKVQLFSKGFPNTKENPSDDEKDIFFSDLSFQGMKMLTQEEMDTVALSLVAKKGYIFEGPQLTQLPIEAVVRAAGKVVNNSLQILKYYWFVKNVTITASSVYYCKEGGQGWKCLNDYKTISKDKGGSPTKIQYNSAGPTLKINKKKANVKENKYKCVVVYGNASYSKEFTIRNEDADYEITITSNKGTVFESGLGKPILTCKILQNAKEIQDYNNYIFNWIVTDQVGVSTEIGTKREISYDVQKIIGFNKFSCTVTDENFNPIGTAEITLVNKKTSDGGFKLIIENGQQVFNYNEQGVSPCKNKLINFVIPQLSFILYDKMGQKVDQNLIDLNNITWRIKGGKKSTIITSLTTGDNKKAAEYTIHDYYQANDNNDNIQLIINYAGYELTATTNFIFTQQGYAGTNGTGMIAMIDVQYIKGTTNKVPMLSCNKNLKGEKITAHTNISKLYARLYQNNGKEIKLTNNNGVKNLAYGWSILKGSRNQQTFIKLNDDNINSQTMTVSVSQNISNTNNIKVGEKFSNIIQVQIIYQGKNYFATLPIVVAQHTNDYFIYLKENTGFQEVLYSEDGMYPKYQNKGFNIIVADDLGKTIQTGINYYFRGNSRDISGVTSKTDQSFSYQPSTNYDGQNVSKYVYCKAVVNNNSLYICIPIYHHLNLYGHSALNEWNGNSIQFKDNNGKDSIILTPQIGAGSKDKTTNTFTGMLMGTVKGDKTQTGLFGYKDGARSIFLDSDTGNATFGIQGNGQILIKPDSGTITGGNYKEVEKNDKGEITKAGSGMKIDLKAPSITFGSKNFSVNQNGELTAKGNGSIAGWKISDTALTKGDVGMSSDNTTQTINNVVKQGLRKKAFWAGKFSDDDTNPDHAPFSVDFKGRVVMKQAQIGGAFGSESYNKVWIKDGTIYTENVVQKEDGTKYKNTLQNHNTFDSPYEGFYIGSDGISLGKYFSIDNKGTLITKKGYIGDPPKKDKGVWDSNGFVIDSNAICSYGKRVTDSSPSPTKNGIRGIRLTKSYISLGPNAQFYVNENGWLTSVYGQIGGWRIDENAIYRDLTDAKHNDFGPMKAKRDKDGNIVTDKNGKTVLIYGDKPYEDGLYFGKGGLRMGGNFHVDSQGNLYAINGNFAGKITSSEGNIAGWKLSDSSLTGGSMTIKSNGSMSGKNWSITADGKASFSNAHISGGVIGGNKNGRPRINPTSTDVGGSGGTSMEGWTKKIAADEIVAKKAWIEEIAAKKVKTTYLEKNGRVARWHGAHVATDVSLSVNTTSISGTTVVTSVSIKKVSKVWIYYLGWSGEAKGR